jgi:acyl-CoA synthetase (AMP-forming)/AMP-acid ligase II/acyl carrier protein
MPAAETPYDAIIAHARQRPGATALLAPGRAPLDYQALAATLDALGAELAAAGLGRGARIAVAHPSGADAAMAMLAALTWATCTPLDPTLDAAGARRAFTRLGIDALIAPDDDALPVVAAARAMSLPLLRIASAPDAPAGCFRMHVERARDAVLPVRPRRDDLALVLQTSGTTATPKAVPQTQWQTLWGARQVPIDRDDRALCVSPVHASGPLSASVVAPLVVGASTVITAGFDAARFAGWLDTYAPTYWSASATIQGAILDALHGARPSSLSFVMATSKALPPALQARLEAAFGVPVLQGYGMTECGLIALNPSARGAQRHGSVGQPLRTEVEIRDEAGAALPAGEIGEVMVKSPQLMAGYDRDPEATRAAFADGWLRTGDLGYRDGDGYLYLTGRRNERINRGGLMVSPAEVDEVLMRHPAVREAVSFPVPHASLGEDLAAAVVLHASSAATAKELRDHAIAHLVPHKVPSSVLVVPDLPRNAAGKVTRGALAERLRDALHTAYMPAREGDERIVAEAYSEVLGLPRVGARDHFFNLGGDSLRAAQVIARLQARTGVDVGAIALFLAPSVAELATLLCAAREAAAGDGAVVALAPRRRDVRRG